MAASGLLSSRHAPYELAQRRQLLGLAKAAIGVLQGVGPLLHFLLEIRVAAGERFGHVIERVRQPAELVGPVGLNPGREVSGAHPIGRAQQRLDRPQDSGVQHHRTDPAGEQQDEDEGPGRQIARADAPAEVSQHRFELRPLEAAQPIELSADLAVQPLEPQDLGRSPAPLAGSQALVDVHGKQAQLGLQDPNPLHDEPLVPADIELQVLRSLLAQAVVQHPGPLEKRRLGLLDLLTQLVGLLGVAAGELLIELRRAPEVVHQPRPLGGESRRLIADPQRKGENKEENAGKQGVELVLQAHDTKGRSTDLSDAGAARGREDVKRASTTGAEMAAMAATRTSGGE